MLACASMMACAFASAEVHAQEPHAATTKNEDEAQRFYREANAAFKREAWAEAEALYMKAWALSKSFDVAANLGETEVELGKHREAAGYLSFSLRTAPPSSKAEQRERTRASLNAAKKKLLTIRLATNVSAPTVTLDGAALDPALVGPEIFASSGTHVVQVSAAGYQPARRTVEGAEGAAIDVKVDLVPDQSVQRNRLPGYLIAGAGAAGLIAAGVLLGVYEGKRAEIDAKGPVDDAGKPRCVKAPSTSGGSECDAIRALGSQANTLGNAGLATLVAGSAAVAGGVLYLVWPAPKAAANQPASRVLPVANADGAGIVWMGSF